VTAAHSIIKFVSAQSPADPQPSRLPSFQIRLSVSRRSLLPERQPLRQTRVDDFILRAPDVVFEAAELDQVLLGVKRRNSFQARSATSRVRASLI